jgi:hypothetical protein
LLRSEVGRPLEAIRGGETQVGVERVAHRVDEPLGPARREALLPPDVEHLHAGVGPVDPRRDPADQAAPNEIGSTYQVARNQANSLAGTSESPLLYASKTSRHRTTRKRRAASAVTLTRRTLATRTSMRRAL